MSTDEGDHNSTAGSIIVTGTDLRRNDAQRRTQMHVNKRTKAGLVLVGLTLVLTACGSSSKAKTLTQSKYSEIACVVS
jgi:hypothetical protein